MIPSTVDHAAEALERLTDSFSGRPNIEAIVNALAARVQELDDATLEAMSARLIGTAADDALDKLGSIVGEVRNGRSDSDYRAAIRLRIRINISDGRSVDMVDIANLTAGSSTSYAEGETAAFEITSYDVEGAPSIIKVLAEARPAGVYGVFTYSDWDPESNLVRGSSTGTGYGQNVRGSTTGSVTGAGLRVSSTEI